MSSVELNSAPPDDVVAERLAGIRARVTAAGGDPQKITIVGVTKGFDESAPRAAYAAGLRDIGENYPDELISKASSVEAPPVLWHMLGAIQRRRVKALAAVVGCWQTVSRPQEVTSIASHSPGVSVFVQVDTTGLSGRNGAEPSEVPGIVALARDAGLSVRGLMTIGPPADPERAAHGFELVASLARDLGLDEISMGMTDDLEVAVRAGSTMLRVGRALFGPRRAAPC